MYKLYVFCVLLMFYSPSHSANKCSLYLKDEIEFEKNIISYFDKDGTTYVLEYDLDFSGIENNFDIKNSTDPDLLQPGRWYHTNGNAISKVILFYNKYKDLFSWLNNYKKFDVKVLDRPVGCLSNISKDNMENFIAEFLLHDFGISIETLRTSVKLSMDVEICTEHLSDNHSTDTYFRCCGYDIHGHMNCDSLLKSKLLEATEYIVGIFIAVVLLYSPLLFFKKRQKSDLTNVKKAPDSLIIAYKELNIKITDKIDAKNKSTTISLNDLKEKSNCMDVFLNLQKDVIYTIKTKCTTYFMEQANYFEEKKPTIKSLTSMIRTMLRNNKYTESTENKIKSSDQKDTVLKYRILVIVFLTLFLQAPNILNFAWNFLFYDKERFKALDALGREDLDFDILFYFLLFSYNIYLCCLILLSTRNSKTGKALRKYHKNLNEYRSHLLHCLESVKNRCFHPCVYFVYWFFFLIIFLVNLIFNNPLNTLVISIFPPNNVSKCSFKFLLYGIMTLLTMLFLYSLSSFYSFIIVGLGLCFIQASNICSILSAFSAFVLYIRELLKEIYVEHDECLNNIVNHIKHEMVNIEDLKSTLDNLTFSKMILYLNNSEKKERVLVEKNSLYYVLSNSSIAVKTLKAIHVNKSLVIYLTSGIYLKSLTKLLIIALFLILVVMIVGLISQFNSLSLANQVFITLITSLIPLAAKLMSMFKKDNTENTAAKQNEHSFKPKSLRSYSEYVLIDHLQFDKNVRRNEEMYLESNNVDIYVYWPPSTESDVQLNVINEHQRENEPLLTA